MDLRGVKIGTLLGVGVVVIIGMIVVPTIYANYLSTSAQEIMEKSSRRTFDALTVKRDMDEFFSALDETVVLIRDYELDIAWDRTVSAHNRVKTTLDESREKKIFTEEELRRAEEILEETSNIGVRYFKLKRELVEEGADRGRTFEGGYSPKSVELSNEFDKLTEKKYEMLGVITNIIFRSDKESVAAMSLVRRSQIISWVVVGMSLVVALIMAYFLVRFAKKIYDLKNEFINIIAHDLRNPVTAILGYLDIIMTSKDMNIADTKEKLKIVEVATHRLRTQINNLLEVGREEAGYAKINLEPVMVAGVLKETVIRAKAFAETKGMTIKYDEPVSEEIYVLADRHKMNDVIDNLISNAVKYNREKGLVTITTRDAGKNFSISVTDTGYGIPEEKKDEIFKKYSRLETGSKKRVGGTGLGLYTVKLAMEQMKGTVTFTTEEGKGTTFTISLPKTDKAKE